MECECEIVSVVMGSDKVMMEALGEFNEGRGDWGDVLKGDCAWRGNKVVCYPTLKAFGRKV